MTTENPRKSRGRPFKPGNPGKPKGARNAARLGCEALLDGEAEALTRKAIEQVKAGDMGAFKLCLERISPAGRERPITFDLPDVAGAADHPAALVALLGVVAAGEESGVPRKEWREAFYEAYKGNSSSARTIFSRNVNRLCDDAPTNGDGLCFLSASTIARHVAT